jgi:predicted nucleic acid-binding protein
MPPFPPDGAAVFIDANIVYYHFVRVPELSEWSSQLLERFAQRRLSVFASTHVIAEAIHKIMAAEAAQRFSIPRPAIVTHLRHHPERLAELTMFRTAASELEVIAMPLLATDARMVVEAADLSLSHGLLTNDALTVALMRRNGLADLASNDDDFNRVPALTVWKPQP